VIIKEEPTNSHFDVHADGDAQKKKFLRYSNLLGNN